MGSNNISNKILIFKAAKPVIFMRKRIWDTITRSLPLSIATVFLFAILLDVIFWTIGLEELKQRTFIREAIFAAVFGTWTYFHYKQERKLKKAGIKS